MGNRPAALGQDVDPDVLDHQRLVAKVELEVLGKGRDVLVDGGHQIRQYSYPNDVYLQLKRQREAGEAVVLLGPSGAGKTTLLALLDGRLQGWTGCVSVLGRGLAPDAPPPVAARPDTGFIFQEFALVERSSVLRNVLNGRLGRMSSVAACMASRTRCRVDPIWARYPGGSASETREPSRLHGYMATR